MIGKTLNKRPFMAQKIINILNYIHKYIGSQSRDLCTDFYVLIATYSM